MSRDEAKAQENAPATEADSLSFNQALEQLEGILESIESEEIDIDRLATELGRGSELLEICRTKIRKAELEVLQIVERLDDPVPAAIRSPSES